MLLGQVQFVLDRRIEGGQRFLQETLGQGLDRLVVLHAVAQGLFARLLDQAARITPGQAYHATQASVADAAIALEPLPAQGVRGWSDVFGLRQDAARFA